METIATAKPNPKYRYYNCVKNVVFNAVKQKRNIVFYLVENGIPKRMSKEEVRKFFKLGVKINKQPFLKKGNEKFYELLK